MSEPTTQCFRITEEEEQARQDRRDWYDRHSACPNCGRRDVVQTCIGVGTISGHPFEDNSNRAHCVCGWSGKVKDLTP